MSYQFTVAGYYLNYKITYFHIIIKILVIFRFLKMYNTFIKRLINNEFY